MKPVFTPEMFEWNAHEFEGRKFIRIEYAANVANRELAKLIESWPVVYSYGRCVSWDSVNTTYVTHQARLAFIEELPKKDDCPHRPVIDSNAWAFEGTLKAKCYHCKKDLVAKWEAK